MKKFLLSVFFSILLLSFTCLAAETEIKPSYFGANSINLVYDPSVSNYVPYLSVTPVIPLARPSYDKNTIFIEGPSEVRRTVADFKIRFGRTSSSDGNVPLSYSKYWSMGSSFFIGSDMYTGCDYSSYLDLIPHNEFAWHYYYDPDHVPDSSWPCPEPSRYTNSSTGSLSKLLFSDAHSLGYSDNHSWTHWTGIPFTTNQLSNLYFGHYIASLDPGYTELNFDFPFSSLSSPLNNQPSNVLSVMGDDYFSFRSLLDQNLSDDVYGSYFGLTLTEGSLDILLQSLYFTYFPDTFDLDNSSAVLPGQLLNENRAYETVVDPMRTQFVYTAGVYYSLIPSNSRLKPCGPYLFNTAYDISEIDPDTQYKVRLEVYIGDVQVKLSDFVPLSEITSLYNPDAFFVQQILNQNGIPRVICPSSSTATTSFGSNGYIFADILYLNNFSFIPTIWVDSSLADVNDSLKDLNNSFNSGFSSLNDTIQDGFYGTIEQLDKIDNTIKDSTKSVNQTLNSVADKISSSIDSAADDITHGYDSSAAQALLDEFDRTGSEFNDSAGDIFDILKASLDQSNFSIPSWADFSSLFTSFQFAGNYGLTAVYTLLGGSAVVGLVLSFYFALKALWSIIHRGN